MTCISVFSYFQLQSLQNIALASNELYHPVARMEMVYVVATSPWVEFCLSAIPFQGRNGPKLSCYFWAKFHQI